MAYHHPIQTDPKRYNGFPCHPSSASYSFSDHYHVKDGYQILHLPHLIYPGLKAPRPGAIYLNVPTVGGALRLGAGTHFVTEPQEVQETHDGILLYVNSTTVKVKSNADGTNDVCCRLSGGAHDGQHLWLLNEGPKCVSFDRDQKISRIKNSFGTGFSVVPAGTFNHYIWNATDCLWYVARHDVND